MIATTLILLCILFIEGSIRLRISSNVSGILVSSQNAVETLRSPEFDDLTKEVAARQGSLAVFRHTATFLFKLVLVVALLGSAFLAATELAGVSADQLIQGALSVRGIIGLTIVGYVYVRARRVFGF